MAGAVDVTQPAGLRTTAGPWRVKVGPGGEVDVIGTYASQSRTVVFDVAGNGQAQRTANAHVIAAAPELYAALETLLTDHLAVLGDGVELNPPLPVVLALAALKKARGEA